MERPALTDQQRRAVDDRGGELLVSAAAGSGKTKVLVERLFAYVMEEGRNLDDFLIITYTRAAAAELRGKIAAALTQRIGRAPEDAHLRAQLLRVYQADIRTVDAFCTALLREHIHLLAREEGPCLPPDFRVLDEQDAQLLRRRVLERVLEKFYRRLDDGGALLADTLGAGRDDGALEALVLECHKRLQSHARPEEWLSAQARLWKRLGKAPAAAPAGFDVTPYARTLLEGVRRRAAHWKERLWQAAESTRGGPLETGYGQRFAAAAESLAPLSRAQRWEDGRQALARLTFPRLSTPRGMKDEPEVLRLKGLWDAAKDGCRRMEALLAVSGQEAAADLAAMAPAMTTLLELTERFSRAYTDEKRRRGCADFSDQEHLALTLLTEKDGAPTELGRRIAQRYREVLVDEYQDANEIQNAIFQALSEGGRRLFTVGDVKQSIYRFRLADPGIFLERYRRFAPAAEAGPGEPRKILLSRNFRSRREVLEAVNFLFSAILSPQMGEMAYGEEESLHFGAAFYPPREDCRTEFHLVAAHRRSPAHPHPVKKVDAEARFTARRIRELLEEGFPVTGEDGALRPCRPEDIVILMRAPGSRSEVFVQALAREGIPCALDRSGGFFETMEVSVALALLEIVDNPRQDVHLITALRAPVFGFTADRLAQLRCADRGGELYDALLADPGEDVRAFLKTLGELRQAAADMPAGRFLWHLYDVLALPAVFAAMDDGARRQENLVALGRYVQGFDASGGGVFSFLSRLRQLLGAGETPEIRVGGGAAGVGIMSIHRSKGLEFPVVFLCDLDRAFSRQDLSAAVLVHPTLGLGPQCVDLGRRIRYPTMARQAVEAALRRENLSEEQRILYVAMTRAKEKLVMVHALQDPARRLRKISAAAAVPLPPETVAEGRCFGDWILPVLLCRPEAAGLRALAAAETEALAPPADFPWQVQIHEAEDFGRDALPASGPAAAAQESAFDPDLLTFVYPYQYQSRLPAKRAATDWKGRLLDEWVRENAGVSARLRPLRRIAFRGEGGMTAAERGSAMHLCLQYLDFSRGDAAAQVEKLCRDGCLTARQAAALDVSALERFLASDLAREIAGAAAEREYCFSVLLPAREYDPRAVGEDEILLQGVVDCWFETAEGVTVVDFKTDAVETEAEIARRAKAYFSQMQAYSLALERVLEKPVVRRLLHFLHPGKTVAVPRT